MSLVKSFVLSCLRALARAVPALGTLLRPLIGGAYERVPEFSAADDDDTTVAMSALEASRTAGLHARGRSPGLGSNANAESRAGERSLSTSLKPGTMRLGGGGRASVPPAPRSTSVSAGSNASPPGPEAARSAQDASPQPLPAQSPSPVTASDWDESETWEEDN